jgi:hypothetical protein
MPEIIEGESGPPIGDPPEHTHEVPVVVEESADEVEEDIDELLVAVQNLAGGNTQILERLETCQTRLEVLSTTATAENPVLTQMLNQLVEMRAQLMSLNSSMDSRLRVPPQSESPEANLEEPRAEESMVEPSVENEEPQKTRKNRFV